MGRMTMAIHGEFLMRRDAESLFMGLKFAGVNG